MSSSSLQRGSSNSLFLWGAFSATTVITAMFLSPVSLPERLSSKRFPVYDKTTQEGAVFVTGASSGIGRHAALALVEEGHDVFVTVRKASDAESLKEELSQNSNNDDNASVVDRLHPLICDVTNGDQIEDAKRSVESWLLQPQKRKRVLVGIVNNAGMNSELELLETMSGETLDRVWNVNVKGPFLVYRAFLPLLRLNDTGGRIVNVGSLAGQASRPFRGAYTVSKFALEGLSDTMRQELYFEEHGISVSMVNPGYIQTNIMSKTLREDTTAAESRMTPTQQDMLRAFRDNHGKVFRNAGSTTETTEAIRHALFNPKPRTRYYPGNIGIGPLKAWLFPKMKILLPDRVYDRFTCKKRTLPEQNTRASHSF